MYRSLGTAIFLTILASVVCSTDNATPPKTITNSIDMRLVLIPAGQFVMGSPIDEEERKEDESPQHRVRITRPFYLGTCEVTQEQYERIMGKSLSEFKGRKRPAENVSWNDAVEFCRRLSRREGRTYRLPTEAEWEYACRAGTTTAFTYGKTLSFQTDACFNADGIYGESPRGADREDTMRVQSYRANAWGLYDMHGNVREWCQDWYASEYYHKSPSENPQGPASGSYRITRGGAWNVDAAGCRSADRDGCAPNMRDPSRGFRVTSDPAEAE